MIGIMLLIMNNALHSEVLLVHWRPVG